jgi:rhodanese-related sulfurtransferase
MRGSNGAFLEAGRPQFLFGAKTNSRVSARSLSRARRSHNEGTDLGPARCDDIGFPARHWRIAGDARGILEMGALSFYMGWAAALAPVKGAHRVDLGDIMSGNSFSPFGAGSDPDVVSFGDLEEAVGTNAWTVVDVREPHEFAAGHIPNAVNAPMSSFDPGELPEGKPVVLVCQSGGRSRNALNKARSVGRDDVRHFAEGMNGWRSHNGPVTL